uniref:PX domain-containing protein n=1 Tax=Nothobranchius furzeri TaxID=105023 RepID=A0A8C6L9Y2_NOTFU
MVLQEDFHMIEVSIPSLEKEVDESGRNKKLFRVEVLFNERKHYVLRRNSEFQNLHRKLRKIIQTPDFPSKRNPHLRTKPTKQRRQELEDYIQVSPHTHKQGFNTPSRSRTLKKSFCILKDLMRLGIFPT